MLLKEVSEEEITKKYLAEQGLVAVERQLMDNLASAAYRRKIDYEIIYYPHDDCYKSYRSLK